MSAIDPDFRINDPTGEVEWPAMAAVAAALLLHAALFAWLLVDWHRPPSAEVPVMVATLVREPPQPPPAAAPKAQSQPRQPLATRVSGADDKTTAPAPAETLADIPETPPPAEAALAPPTPPAPPPATEATPTTQTVSEAPPPPTAPSEPAAEPAQKPKRVAARAEPRRDQLVSRGPTAPLENRTLGEREETGDPYLNGMWGRIEEQRAPTTPIGSSGLHLEGVATWELMLGRNGDVEDMELVRSSGSELLDAEARRMIVAAAPFPPPPPEFPDHAPIKVTIRLFPR